MATIHTANLTPMQLGRLNIALDKRYRFDGVVMTLREKIEASDGVKREWALVEEAGAWKVDLAGTASRRAWDVTYREAK